MVDPLGTTPIKPAKRVTAVSRVATPVAPAPVASRAIETASQPTLAATAKDFAAQPPVDLDRVARIRKAIADGTFPIVPAQIADRLIASKLDWLRNDTE